MNDEVAVDSPEDVNVAGDAGIDDGEDEDAGDFEDGDAGNRVSGGTPLAVVTYLVKSIAGEPDEVVINTEERNGTVRFQIHVAPDDMGRIIGRRGRVAQAIRTVVAAAGARDGVQTNVDIADD